MTPAEVTPVSTEVALASGANLEEQGRAAAAERRVEVGSPPFYLLSFLIFVIALRLVVAFGLVRFDCVGVPLRRRLVVCRLF